MKSIEDLPAWDDHLRCANVIIETPKGSSVKFSYQPAMGLFYAKRLLPPGMVFPFNFGFIPSTVGEDGDPLDILLVTDMPLVCGCVVKARLVGLVNAEQTEEGKTTRNDRIIGAIQDEESPAVFLHVEFGQRLLSEIEYFFATYNQFSGKEFKVLGTGGGKEAEQLIREGEAKYRQENKAA